MTVVQQLGRADLEQGLADARRLWAGWVDQDRRLAPAPAVDGLQHWLLSVDIDTADQVLHALTRVGSPTGGNCQPAVWVVVWALLPGACRVASRAGAGQETDALVASQLWLEIRQFPWRRHQKVAGNVLANLRAAVRRQGALARPSWTERHTSPTDLLPERKVETPVSPAEELADVLSWGEQAGLIGADDHDLLRRLVEETDRLTTRPVCRTGHGLMSAPALASVAERVGLSPGTVRRRARRSIDALSAACRSGLFQDPV